MRKQKEANLPQMTNFHEMTRFDFRKARGWMWIKYQEHCATLFHAMYPDLQDDDFLLVDFDDKDLDKGYLFLLYFEDHDPCRFIVRQVRKYPPNMIQVTMLSYTHFPPYLYDLSKQPNPILGRVLCSVRNWAFKG